MSAYGSLLGAVGSKTDLLWTPQPVVERRLPYNLLQRRLHGPMAQLPAELLATVSEIVPWGETLSIASLRRRWRRNLFGGGDNPGVMPESSVDVAGLAAAARAANHRGWALALARELEEELPGSAEVKDDETLGTALKAARAQGHDGRWIVKAAFSAAGRHRHLSAGTQEPAPEDEQRARALLRRWGHGVVEPWMDRTADFGALCAVDAEGALGPVSFHRQYVGSRGQFRGLEIVTGRTDGEAVGLSMSETARLHRVVESVGGALNRLGYRGPFGIDAWRFRATSSKISDARSAFCPLGEINARLSFGRVLRGLESRLLLEGRIHIGQRLLLHLRTDAAPTPTGDGWLPLLAVEDGAPGSAVAQILPPL